MQTVKHILLAENENSTRRILASKITGGGYELTEVDDGDKALNVLENLKNSGHPVQLIIADISMVSSLGMGGLDLIQEIHKRGMDIPVLAISKHGAEASLLALLPKEPFGYTVKPFKLKDILDGINEISVGGNN